MNDHILHIRRTLRSREGIGLLEVVIAMFIFAVGIVATIGMQIAAIDGADDARRRMDAASLSANIIEQLRPLNYVNAPELNSGDHDLPDVGEYTVSYTVQRDVLLNDTMLIRVTVGWSQKGNNRTISYDYVKGDVI